MFTNLAMQLLCRNSRLAEALAAAEELGGRVIENNLVLENEARDRDRNNFEVDEYLRTDLASLQKELTDQRASSVEVRCNIGKAQG